MTDARARGGHPERKTRDSHSEPLEVRGLGAGHPKRERADWQFDPREFDRLRDWVHDQHGVTLSLDGAAAKGGANALLPRFCTKDDSFLERDVSGEAIWLNPPFHLIAECIAHYQECKARSPGTSMLLVVPEWKSKPWWPLLDGWEAVRRFPTGTQLFTAAPKPGSTTRTVYGPTRWPVRVYWDPPQPTLSAPPTAAPVPGSPEDVMPERVTVLTWDDRDPHERLAAAVTPASLMEFTVNVNGVKCLALLDSGSTGTLVDPSVLLATGVEAQPHPHPVRVKLADGRQIQSPGYIRGRLAVGPWRGVTKLAVLPLNRWKVILGMDWMVRNQAVIVPATGQLHLGRLVMTANAGEAVRRRSTPPDERLMTAREARKTLRKRPEDCCMVLLQQVQGPTAEPGPDPPPESVARILDEFRDVTAPLPPGLPPERPVQHRIELEPGSGPVFKRGWRMSPLELAEAKAQISDLLEKGWIRHSSSPFSAPLLFVKKKDGTMRMCVDYRALNAVTIRDRGPIPRIAELMDQLAGSTVFSKLDLASGYHQMRIEEASVPRTAFTCTVGHFEWLVMPFGLSGAPASFQRLMNSLLVDLLGRGVIVYLDDILVHASTQAEHDTLLREVFERLRRAKLHVKASKCDFSRSSLPYLGHIVGRDGVAADPALVKAVADWPVPRTMKQLRGFLGTANFYRKFVPRYSAVAAPLTDLTRGETLGPWTPSHQRAFDQIKELLTNAPVLANPDFSGRFPYVVTTDASAFAVGAVLEQQQPDGAYRPLAYFSRKMSETETRYGAYDREALALVAALDEWRVYLEGVQFQLRTDHEALKYLRTQEATNRRVARWISKIQGYTFDISHVAGKANRADALSRRPDHEAVAAGEPPLPHALNSLLVAEYDESLLGDFRRGYEHDPRFEAGAHPAGFRQDEHGLWRIDGKIAMPNNDAVKDQVLQRLHSGPTGAHLGFDRTLAACRDRFDWPGVARDVQEFTRSCSQCQRAKALNFPAAQPLMPLPVPDAPWEWVTMDLVTGLPRSREGHDAVLVFVDRFSKMTHFAGCRKTLSAEGMARLFLHYVFRLHGLPKSLTTDRDPRVTSAFWQALVGYLRIASKMSSSKHAQSDGQSERHIRTLTDMLRAVCQEQGVNWGDALPAIERAYNSTVNAVTGMTPEAVCTGRQPVTAFDRAFPTTVPAAYDIARDMEAVYARVKQALVTAADRAAAQHNKRARARAMPEGTQVLVSREMFNLHGDAAHKLQPKWYGPYQVLTERGNTCKLQLPSGLGIHPIINKDRLRVWVSSTRFHNPHVSSAQQPVQLAQPAPAVEVSPPPARVPAIIIIGAARQGRTQRYLVRYEGEDQADRRWVTAGDVSPADLQQCQAWVRAQVLGRALRSRAQQSR